MPTSGRPIGEWETRRARIDPRLEAAGWQVIAYGSIQSPSSGSGWAITEYPTANGPADYALAVDGKILGIVEAKRLTLGPQNVLTQAARYSRGAVANPLNYDGYRVPFLYATNGEVIWHHDVGHFTQDVLAKAFRGELVPTEAELARREGREYEPAEVLLDRIRREREGDGGKGRVRQGQ